MKQFLEVCVDIIALTIAVAVCVGMLFVQIGPHV